MVKALGIGGFFFRAEDPSGLAAWYERHFDITRMGDYGDPGWDQEAGPTVFTPFESKTTYFGRPTQSWMINFRVADLRAAADELIADGIALEVDPMTYPIGRFARLTDPEGNPIQLWEPMDVVPKGDA